MMLFPNAMTGHYSHSFCMCIGLLSWLAFTKKDVLFAERLPCRCRINAATGKKADPSSTASDACIQNVTLNS